MWILGAESKIVVRNLAERSEAKKNPKNCVRFFDIIPIIFCSLLPCLFGPMLPAPLSFWPNAPCSLYFWTPFSPLPKTPCRVSIMLYHPKYSDMTSLEIEPLPPCVIGIILGYEGGPMNEVQCWLNQDFLLASLEQRGKLWNSWQFIVEFCNWPILDHLEIWPSSPRGVTEYTWNYCATPLTSTVFKCHLYMLLMGIVVS